MFLLLLLVDFVTLTCVFDRNEMIKIKGASVIVRK